MPLISFSGTTSCGSFWKQILDGKKIQTCRKPRKRPIKKGDTLYLYWKCRVPKDKKPIHFIGEAVCTNIERKSYSEFAYDDDFARKDGFKNSLELRSWFGDPSEWSEREGLVLSLAPPYRSDDEYNVIQFKLEDLEKN